MKKFSFPFKLINYLPVVGIAVLVIVFILWLGFLLPKFQQFRDINGSISQKEAELQQREDQYSNLLEINEKLNGYSAELAKIESALPQNADIPSLFKFIEEVGSESGLFLSEIGSYSTSQAKENTRIKVIDFNIGAQGDYSSCKSFLSALENSSRLIEIKEVSLSGAGTEENDLEMHLSLKTYSY